MAVSRGRSTWSLEVIVTRRGLAYVVAGLAVAGAIAAAVPFARSWRMNDAAKLGHLAVSLGDIPVGSFKVIDRSNERIFVIRRSPVDVAIFGVPIYYGGVYLPDSSWVHLAGPCRTFGPDNLDGRLTPGGSFRCTDPEAAESTSQFYRWSFDGRALDRTFGAARDLPPIAFELSGNVATLRRPQ